MKILTIIDAYGWAYDVGMSGLYKELRKNHPKWVLDKCLYLDVREDRVDARKYDIVFAWAWMDVYNNRTRPWMDILRKLDPEKTVLCMAGEHYLHMLNDCFNQIWPLHFKYFAGNNDKISEAIRIAGLYKLVYTLEFGVDLEMFKPAPFPRRFTVGWVGHQGRELKRYQLAKRICGGIGVPIKPAGHVFGKAYIPHSEMPGFYDSVSCLFITSEWEAHPLVYYEALASGRGVVSTLVGDIPNTARHGKNGYYFPVDCPLEQIANYLHSLRHNLALVKYMGEQARKDAELHWGWNKISKQYLNVINKVCNK